MGVITFTTVKTGNLFIVTFSILFLITYSRVNEFTKQSLTLKCN